MQVTYSLEKRDRVGLNRQVRSLSAALRSVFVTAAIMCVFAVGLLFVKNPLLFAGRPLLALLLILVAGARPFGLILLFAFLIRYFGFSFNLFGRASAGKMASAPQTLEITPTHINAWVGANSARYQWNAVQRITQDQERFYLFTSKTTAIIVPKRAFATPDQAQEFHRLMMDYWNGMRYVGGPVPTAQAQTAIANSPGALPHSEETDKQGVTMQVTYHITQSDCVRFLRRNRSIRQILRAFMNWVVLVVLMNWVIALLTESSRLTSDPVSLLVTTFQDDPGLYEFLALAMAVYLIYMPPILGARRIAARPNFKLPTTVEISPGGVRTSHSMGIQQVQWFGIKSISQDAYSLYLYTAKNNAFIIPKRAFATPEQAENFYLLVMAYWKGTPLPEISDKAEQEIWPPAPKR